MILSGKNNDSFELELIGYQFPHTKSGDDANWLMIRTSAVVNGQKWTSLDPSLMTSEVRRLAEWLEAVAGGKQTDTAWYFVEPNISFELLNSSDNEVHLRVLLELESRAPWLKGADVGEAPHGPTIECSKQQVAGWASDLRRQLARFPFR